MPGSPLSCSSAIEPQRTLSLATYTAQHKAMMNTESRESLVPTDIMGSGQGRGRHVQVQMFARASGLEACLPRGETCDRLTPRQRTPELTRGSGSRDTTPPEQLSRPDLQATNRFETRLVFDWYPYYPTRVWSPSPVLSLTHARLR